MSATGKPPSRLMRTMRALAVPIIVFWVGITIVTNVFVPQIETVAREHAVSMSPDDAPAVIAAKRIGANFQESDSDSIVMIVLEGDEQLGKDAREYYAGLVQLLKDDTEHIQHVQDLWGDLVTAGGVQSGDGKAAYLQLNVAGNQGSTEGIRSVDAVREIVAEHAPRQGSGPTSPARRH